jgi:hypothetical protein
MNDVISTLKSRRNELALELGRIDKAIAILSNGSAGANASGTATRARVPKPMQEPRHGLEIRDESFALN